MVVRACWKMSASRLKVAEGLGSEGALLARIHALSGRVAAGESGLQNELSDLQRHLNPETGWVLQQKIEGVIARVGLDASGRFDLLSTGVQRRVLLARALVDTPDVLLLDEPINHLDFDAIAWLEDFLLREGITLVFVTHDRMFLTRLATRIIEVERGRLFDWTCDYATFQVRKAAADEAQARQEDLFDKSWRRRKSGFARESKPAGHETKGACGHRPPRIAGDRTLRSRRMISTRKRWSCWKNC